MSPCTWLTSLTEIHWGRVLEMVLSKPCPSERRWHSGNFTGWETPAPTLCIALLPPGLIRRSHFQIWNVFILIMCLRWFEWKSVGAHRGILVRPYSSSERLSLLYPTGLHNRMIWPKTWVAGVLKGLYLLVLYTLTLEVRGLLPFPLLMYKRSIINKVGVTGYWPRALPKLSFVFLISGHIFLCNGI